MPFSIEFFYRILLAGGVSLGLLGGRPAEAQWADHFTLETTLSSVFDSNIDHDSDSIDSYGVIVGATAGYRSARLRPAFQLLYGVALHSYSRTDRWDRVSHLGQALLDQPIFGPLRAGVTAEASLNGTSEDRQLGDEFGVLPRVEVRLSDVTLVRLVGALRWRNYDDGRSTLNRFVALESRVGVATGELDLSARFEENESDTPRFRFDRRTYRARYAFPAGGADELRFGLRYSPVVYPERFVEVGNEDVRRRDRKWTPQLRWDREWIDDLSTELEYEFETRSSTDPNRSYRGHVLTLTTIYTW
jgi:hypothetical protein